MVAALEKQTYRQTARTAASAGKQRTTVHLLLTRIVYYTQKSAFLLTYAYAQIYRDKVESMLIPQLTSFAADLLFISAGFDAHEDDFYHFLGT